MKRPGLEIEIKLRVPDVTALRRRVRRLGGRFGRPVHETNILFDTPEGGLRRSGRLLRLRRNDGAGVVTFKGPGALLARRGAGRYKVRREVETAVADPAALEAILHSLGLRPGFRYEKYRRVLTLPGASPVVAVLDETPLGWFLELEGPPAAIDRAARTLRCAPRDYETRSYLALYLQDCRDRHVPPGDFVFPARNKRKKPSVLR
jgi:adenylate cyclase class 2